MIEHVVIITKPIEDQTFKPGFKVDHQFLFQAVIELDDYFFQSFHKGWFMCCSAAQYPPVAAAHPLPAQSCFVQKVPLAALLCPVRPQDDAFFVHVDADKVLPQWQIIRMHGYSPCRIVLHAKRYWTEQRRHVFS